MAHIIPGDGFGKAHHPGARSPSYSATNAKFVSGGMGSTSTAASALPKWKPKYHYNRHQKYLPSPPYYAGPPHPGYYHAYYYHYPPIPRLYHRRQWPIGSVPNDHSSSSKPKKEASTASPATAGKIDAKSGRPKADCFKNSTTKEHSVTEKVNAPVSSKKNVIDEANAKKWSGGDYVPHLPSNLNLTTMSNKRPLSPTKASTSLSLSSTSKEIAATNKEKCTSIVHSTTNGLKTEFSCDTTTNSCAPKDSRREVHNESTRTEVKQLADTFDMDTIIDSCDQPCVHSKRRNHQFPPFYDVIDPVDLKLMASTSFVTFKNIGAGLDSSCNSSEKGKSKTSISGLRCTEETRKRSKEDKCPGMMHHLNTDNKENPSARKRKKRKNAGVSLSSLRSKNSMSRTCTSDSVKTNKKRVVSNSKWSNECPNMIETSDELFGSKTENSDQDVTTNEGFTDRNNHNIQLVDAPLFNLREENQIHRTNTTTDLIHDSKLPFPEEFLVENNHTMSVGTSLYLAGYNAKESIRVSKDCSTVSISSGFDGIFRTPSVDCQNEESITTSSKKTDNGIAKTKAIEEIDDTNEDVCLDSFIRSIITEDEGDSLIRPPGGFSPTCQWFKPPHLFSNP